MNVGDPSTGTPQGSSRDRARVPRTDELDPQNSGARLQRTQARLAHLTDAVDVSRVTRGLGWFSIGLGIFALLAPRTVGEAIGLGSRAGLLRWIGARELASGIGILAGRDPAPWVWSRVAGDAMDLAVLAAAAGPANPRNARAIGALAAVGGVATLDVACGRHLSSQPVEARLRPPREIHFEQSLSINRAPRECYDFWRNLEGLPGFMRHLKSVRVLDERRSHWVAKGPGGFSVEWDAEITDDQPGEHLAWRSLDGAAVRNAGSVRFERSTDGHGTVLRVRLHYAPPVGKAGAMIARMLGEEPRAQVREDLRRFKQILETGEVATVEGQSSGRRSLLARATREGRRT